jgi:hypothetical protein
MDYGEWWFYYNVNVFTIKSLSSQFVTHYEINLYVNAKKKLIQSFVQKCIFSKQRQKESVYCHPWLLFDYTLELIDNKSRRGVHHILYWRFFPTNFCADVIFYSSSHPLWDSSILCSGKYATFRNTNDVF